MPSHWLLRIGWQGNLFTNWRKRTTHLLSSLCESSLTSNASHNFRKKMKSLEIPQTEKHHSLCSLTSGYARAFAPWISTTKWVLSSSQNFIRSRLVALRFGTGQLFLSNALHYTLVLQGCSLSLLVRPQLPYKPQYTQIYRSSNHFKCIHWSEESALCSLVWVEIFP